MVFLDPHNPVHRRLIQCGRMTNPNSARSEFFRFIRAMSVFVRDNFDQAIDSLKSKAEITTLYFAIISQFHIPKLLDMIKRKKGIFTASDKNEIEGIEKRLSRTNDDALSMQVGTIHKHFVVLFSIFSLEDFTHGFRGNKELVKKINIVLDKLINPVMPILQKRPHTGELVIALKQNIILNLFLNQGMAKQMIEKLKQEDAELPPYIVPFAENHMDMLRRFGIDTDYYINHIQNKPYKEFIDELKKELEDLQVDYPEESLLTEDEIEKHLKFAESFLESRGNHQTFQAVNTADSLARDKATQPALKQKRQAVLISPPKPPPKQATVRLPQITDEEINQAKATIVNYLKDKKDSLSDVSPEAHAQTIIQTLGNRGNEILLKLRLNKRVLASALYSLKIQSRGEIPKLGYLYKKANNITNGTQSASRDKILEGLEKLNEYFNEREHSTGRTFITDVTSGDPNQIDKDILEAYSGTLKNLNFPYELFIKELAKVKLLREQGIGELEIRLRVTEKLGLNEEIYETIKAYRKNGKQTSELDPTIEILRQAFPGLLGEKQICQK